MENNLDLFDDTNYIDVKNVFKDSEEDKQIKKDEKSDDLDPKKTTLDPLEGIERVEHQTSDDTDDEEDIDDNQEDDEDEELTDEQKNLLQQVTDLKELGALFLPDDYEVESLEKAVQDSEVYRNQVATSTVFNSIPDVEIPGVGNAKDLFLYIYEHEGKDIDKFKSTFGADSFNPKEYDLTTEEDRRKVLELYYQKKGFNDTKTRKLVDKIFEDLDDETEATEALGELTTIDAKEKQEHLKQLAADKAQRVEQAKANYDLMNQLLSTKESIGGYPMGKDEKPRALDSIYRQVNVGGNVMSDFDYRLHGVVLRNPELTLALSAFLNTLSEDKNKSVYFDLSKFQRKEKTKAIKNLKEITERVAAGKKNFSSSSDDNSSKKGNFNWNSVIDYSDLT